MEWNCLSVTRRLTWDEVYLTNRTVILYTRKKKGEHLTPRKVPMAERLFKILSRRHAQRDRSKPWVFWHRYWSQKQDCWIEGPYIERKKVMKTLCHRAGVRYFRYHALRHFGASVLDSASVPLGTIQRILGHENRTTTEIYLHSLGSAEVEAVKVFDEVIGEKSNTKSHIDNQGATAQCCNPLI